MVDSSPSSQQIEHLTATLTRYFLLSEKASAQILVTEWLPSMRKRRKSGSPTLHIQTSNPPSEMSRRMPRCDALYNMEPKTPDVYVCGLLTSQALLTIVPRCCLIIFACWTGVQVIQNHELAHMPESDMGKIMRGAHQRV